MSYQVRVLNRQNTELFFLRLSSQIDLFFNDDPIEISTEKVLFSKDLYFVVKEILLGTAATCDPSDPIYPVEEFLSGWFLSMCHSIDHDHIAPDNREELKILIEDAYQFMNSNKLSGTEKIKSHSFSKVGNASNFLDNADDVDLILPRKLF